MPGNVQEKHITMKKAFIISLLTAMVLNVQAQREIIIDGTVTNVDDGIVMRLFLREGRAGKGIAVDTIQNGKFHFEVEAKQELNNFMLMGHSPKFPSWARELYLTPGSHALIHGSNYKIQTWEVECDGKEQIEADSYIKVAREEYNQMMDKLIEREFYWALIESNTATEEERAKAAQKTRDLLKPIYELQFAAEKKEMELMMNKPITSFWLMKLERLSSNPNIHANYPHRDMIVALYNRLSEEQRQSEQGQTIATNLFPPTKIKIGDDMVDTDLYDLEGKIHHLTELKGKYILLDFWSSGCGPCILSIPEMGEIQEIYKDRLTIVSLSSDTERRWKDASAKHSITWYNWSDKKQISGLYLKYGVRGVPHYVLISPEGKITSTWGGYGKGSLLKKMKELIK